jgi:hypothetical protein
MLGTGITALIFASQEGHVEVVRQLVSHSDIDINQGIHGSQLNALHTAATCGHAEVVSHLLSTDTIDVNAVIIGEHFNGATSLILATYIGHSEIVNVLLQHPEINTAASSEGKTAVQWAQASALHAKWGTGEDAEHINMDGRRAIRGMFDRFSAAAGEMKTSDGSERSRVASKGKKKKSKKKGKKKKRNKKGRYM